MTEWAAKSVKGGFAIALAVLSVLTAVAAVGARHVDVYASGFLV